MTAVPAHDSVSEFVVRLVFSTPPASTGPGALQDTDVYVSGGRLTDVSLVTPGLALLRVAPSGPFNVSVVVWGDALTPADPRAAAAGNYTFRVGTGGSGNGTSLGVVVVPYGAPRVTIAPLAPCATCPAGWTHDGVLIPFTVTFSLPVEAFSPQDVVVLGGVLVDVALVLPSAAAAASASLALTSLR